MTTSRTAVPRLLLLVLVVAAAVRLWEIGFGLPGAQARPDETAALAGPAVIVLSGGWRPPNFIYPTLIIYALALLYVVGYWIGKPFTHYATLGAFAESRRQSLAPLLYISRGRKAGGITRASRCRSPSAGPCIWRAWLRPWDC